MPTKHRAETVISQNEDFAIVRQDLKTRGNRTDVITVLDSNTAQVAVQVCTTSAQLLGFWGAAAVAQHSSTGQAAGYTANAGIDTATFTGGTGTKAYTIGDVVRALKRCGFMAAS